jgi:hypothetical protein
MRWLAGDERSAAAYLSDGGKVEQKENGSFSHRVFYSWRRERELAAGPHIDG